MRRSRQMILIAVLAVMSVQCSSGKGDDKAQPRVFVENVTELARYRGSTTITSTTITVPPTTTTTKPLITVPITHPSQIGTGQCGGNLPPCWIMMRESRGKIHVKNPDSSASGKWQILDSTWNGYGGYAHASDAPELVQDAKARTMDICNWQPPNYCSN